MNRTLLLSASVVLATVAGGLWYSATTGTQNLPNLPGAAFAQTADQTAAVEIADMTIGAETAPVKIVEYASFTCPHCANFHKQAFKKLRAEYIDTGKVQFTLREVYFDRFGLWASMVARCGGEMRFYGITDMLFEQQSSWTKGVDPADIAGRLRKIGLTAGMTGEQLDACLSDGDQAQALVGWYQKNAEADDVTATPSFVINGQKYSSMGYDKLVSVIEELSGE